MCCSRFACDFSKVWSFGVSSLFQDALTFSRMFLLGVGRKTEYKRFKENESDGAEQSIQ